MRWTRHGIGALALLCLDGCWLLGERSERTPPGPEGRFDAGAVLDAGAPDGADAQPPRDALAPPDAGPLPPPPPPPLPCFPGEVVLTELEEGTRASATDLVSYGDDWIAVYRMERDFAARRTFVGFVGPDGTLRHTQELSSTDADWIGAGGLYELRSPDGRSALIATSSWRPVDVVGDELVRRLDGFDEGHIGFPVRAYEVLPDGALHVISWFPDGTGAGTYRARSAIVSLTDDGRVDVRSRFVVPGLDVWLSYYGGFLHDGHLNVAELTQVDIDGRRSWNIVDVHLDARSPGDELGWELLGERAVEPGPESYLGFLPESDRALALHRERVDGLPSGPASIVAEPLPGPTARLPTTLLEEESRASVTRDETTLVLVTPSAVHAFALPGEELLAHEDLEGARVRPSRGRLLAFGGSTNPGGRAALVLRCTELR